MKHSNIYKILFFTLFLVVLLVGLRQCRQQIIQHTPPDLSKLLAQQPIKHLGIIMDGNRRWAKKQGLEKWIGHREGVNPVRDTLAFCIEHQIQHLTLYVFSLENFKRPSQELSYLFDILAQEVASKEFNDLMDKGVKVAFIGSRNLFPHKLIPLINDIEEKTKNNTKLSLNLLFCYGGQQELLAAAQELCKRVQNGTGKIPETFEDFKKALWSHDIPPIDLLIRTGGDQRLSNYLPVQSTYSELYFIPCYWPEMTKKELEEAALFFVRSKRNFGG